MIPQFIGDFATELDISKAFEYETESSKTYKLVDNKIIGLIDGKEALRQAIWHMLATERYAYPIYNDDYGIELQQYLGESFDYLETTIENTLESCLTYDDRIESVEVLEVLKLTHDTAKVVFRVGSIFDKLELEVNINVQN